MRKHKCNGCGRPSEYSYCGRCRYVIQRFGADPKDIHELLVGQGFGCKICGGLNGKRHLAIDHDHRTGVIRGLLCTKCNIGIGYIETPELLRKAAKYLEAEIPAIRRIDKTEQIRLEDSELANILAELEATNFKSLRAKARAIATKINSSEEAAMSRLRRYLQKKKDEEIIARYHGGI